MRAAADPLRATRPAAPEEDTAGPISSGTSCRAHDVACDPDFATPPQKLEVCVLLPCRDEALTVGACVQDAITWLTVAGVRGEVLVVDNGSSDASANRARQAGARVHTERSPGYGNAIRAGLAATDATFVVIVDADGSYDLTHIGRVLERLRHGHHLVVGNRFAGGIAPGAMPLSHRLLGNPVLSTLARLATGCHVSDWHCGLRGVHRATAVALNFRSPGMELATEMISTTHRAGMRVGEVSTTLRPAGHPDRTSHLRPVRDGLRHLRAIVGAITRRYPASVK
jgi:hypothetical protein